MSSSLSVCLISYNGEKFISQQIRTIIDQLPADSELIVSDDGSTDRTLDIVSGFNDPRIRVLKTPGFKSPIKNLEFALNNARGDLIFLADQDDEWAPDKVRIVARHLETYDLVMTNAEIVDSKGVPISKSFFDLMGCGPGFLKNIIHNRYLGCCMAFRRTVLQAALPFPEGIGMHDWWIGMIVESFGRPLFLNTPLVAYRRHDSNASSTTSKSTSSFCTKIRWRLNIIVNLIKRRKLAW